MNETNRDNLMTKDQIIELINQVVRDFMIDGIIKPGHVSPKHKPMIMEEMKLLTYNRVDERLLTSTVSQYLVVRKWDKLDHSIGRNPKGTTPLQVQRKEKEEEIKKEVIEKDTKRKKSTKRKTKKKSA